MTAQALRVVPDDLPACLKCGGRPLINGEVARGFCADCWPKRWLKCRVCQVLLGSDPKHDHVHGICGLCLARPEAKRFLQPTAAAAPAIARMFTPADKALIRKLHSLLPIADLLKILNDRLHADLGPRAPSYALEQLHAELQHVVPVTSADAGDWAGLRRAIAQARTSGVLATVTMQVVEDFSVVYQLTPAQRTHLIDTIKHAKEGQ